MGKGKNINEHKLILAGLFIATYTTLLFAIPKTLPLDDSLMVTTIYSVFVFFGLAIDIIFFFYISFYALELSSIKKKEIPFFDIELKQKEIERIRNRLFNFGVYLIFLSFAIPIVALIQPLTEKFDPLVGFLLYLVAYISSAIILTLFFRRMGRPVKISKNTNKPPIKTGQ